MSTKRLLLTFSLAIGVMFAFVLGAFACRLWDAQTKTGSASQMSSDIMSLKVELWRYEDAHDAFPDELGAVMGGHTDAQSHALFSGTFYLSLGDECYLVWYNEMTETLEIEHLTKDWTMVQGDSEKDADCSY